MVNVILKVECVRDLLIAIEKLPGRTAWVPVETLDSDLVDKYSLETLNYTALLLSEAGLIEANITFEGGSVQRMTMQGHEMLDNIRDNRAWRMAKEKASELTSVSLSNLVDLANLSVRKLIGLD